MNSEDLSNNIGHRTRSAGNFFGRRKAKSLKAGQNAAYQTILPQLLIDITKSAPADLNTLFPVTIKKIVVEIGFGGGEHLIHRASLHPEIGFIGCEPFVNGMAKACLAIQTNGLKNIRLYNEDATDLLNWLPDNSISRVDLLYPDPWPKKRHWKRRFLNADNMVRIFRILNPAGEFRFASDIDSYVNWGLNHVHAHGGFNWTAKISDDWRQPWEEWISTRYEQKAIRENRVPTYMIFQKHG